MGNEYLEILSDAFVIITEKYIVAEKSYVWKPVLLTSHHWEHA